MGPPASDRVPRVRPYSGAASLRIHFNYRAFTSYGCTFQNYSAIHISCFPQSTTPNRKRSGLASFPFARRYLGNRCFFLFLGLLRCFSSPRSLRAPMYSMHDAYALPHAGSPIRTSAGLWICAPHPSFSQLITSFFGSQCQGILLMLFLT